MEAVPHHSMSRPVRDHLLDTIPGRFTIRVCYIGFLNRVENASIENLTYRVAFLEGIHVRDKGRECV